MTLNEKIETLVLNGFSIHKTVGACIIKQIMLRTLFLITRQLINISITEILQTPLS